MPTSDTDHNHDTAKEWIAMRVQQSRTDVLPFTWEIPAAIAASWLFLALLALPAGHGAAAWLHGDGFTWPHGQLVESVLALLRGDVDVVTGSRAAPPAGLVYVVIAIAELLVAVVAGFAMALWWRTTGPGTQYGLATQQQVADVLGIGHLRRRRRVIRPDLHRPRLLGRPGRSEDVG